MSAADGVSGSVRPVCPMSSSFWGGSNDGVGLGPKCSGPGLINAKLNSATQRNRILEQVSIGLERKDKEQIANAKTRNTQRFIIEVRFKKTTSSLRGPLRTGFLSILSPLKWSQKNKLEFVFFLTQARPSHIRHSTTWRLLISLQSMGVSTQKIKGHNTTPQISFLKCTNSSSHKARLFLASLLNYDIWITWNDLDVLLYSYDLFAQLLDIECSG
jgi:hypothetical protein